jgi:hypothetical protein
MKHYKSVPICRKVITGIALLSIVLNLNAQSEQVQNLPQFLLPDFSKSILKMKAGKDLTLMLNYNIVTEKMVFLQRGQVFDLIDQGSVDTIIMNSRIFVPVEKIFHEILIEKPVPLFIQHKGKVEEPGRPAAYGGTSQVSSSTYLSRVEVGGGGAVFNMKLPGDIIIKPEPVYWISMNGSKFSFGNERQFLKIFRGKEKEIKAYIKQNRLKFDNSVDIINLVQYSSGLVK